MIEVTVYYDSAIEKYPGIASSLKAILEEASKLESSAIRVSFREKSTLSGDHQVGRVVEDIRRIRPQKRGSVVASGGKALPISGSKRLNLQNTPVLLVREIGSDAKPVYVFPCKVGEKYYGIMEGISFLRRNLERDPVNLPELPGEMEETLVDLLKREPRNLEEGLKFLSSETATSTGKTDLVFSDAGERFLIVEVEREATDSAVGQVLRLSAGFERDHKLPTGSIRASIVCLRINPNVLAAANRAGIEVWRFEEEKEDREKTPGRFRKLSSFLTAA